MYSLLSKSGRKGVRGDRGPRGDDGQPGHPGKCGLKPLQFSSLLLCTIPGKSNNIIIE